MTAPDNPLVGFGIYHGTNNIPRAHPTEPLVIPPVRVDKILRVPVAVCFYVPPITACHISLRIFLTHPSGIRAGGPN